MNPDKLSESEVVIEEIMEDDAVSETFAITSSDPRFTQCVHASDTTTTDSTCEHNHISNSVCKIPGTPLRLRSFRPQSRGMRRRPSCTVSSRSKEEARDTSRRGGNGVVNRERRPSIRTGFGSMRCKGFSDRVLCCHHSRE